MLACLLIAAGGISSDAFACSCAYTITDGFIPKTQPASLPANAKGVLYLYRPHLVALENNDLSARIIAALPPAPEASDFEIKVAGSERKLTPVVRQLNLSALNPAHASQRTFMFKDSSMLKCLDYSGSDSKECRALDKLRYERGEPGKDWILQLLNNGQLTEVTDRLRTRFGLFRIEPMEGFIAAQSYTFALKSAKSHNNSDQTPQLVGGTHTVAIEAASFTTSVAGLVQLKAAGNIESRQVSVPSGGMCSENILADVQTMAFELSPELKRYENSVLLFTARRKGASEPLSVWSYRSSVCSSVPFGRSDVGFAKELFFSPCKVEPYFSRGLPSGSPQTVIGVYGLLELDDELHRTNEVALQFPKREQADCSIANVLASAAQGEKPEALKDQLCNFGGWQDAQTGENLRSVAEFMLKYCKSDDAALRACAVRNFEQLGYAIQLLKEDGFLAFLGKEVLPV